MEMGPKGYLDLHPNDRKARFLPFLIRLIVLACGINQKLKYDADK
jgi:hypothetical protein